MAPYDLNERYFEFWSGFHHHVRSHSSVVTPPTPARTHWVGYRVIPYVELCAAISDKKGWIKAEVALKGDERASKFAGIEAQRAEIESELRAGLSWNRPSAKIALYQAWGNPLASDSQEIYGWLLDKMELLRNVVVSRL